MTRTKKVLLGIGMTIGVVVIGLLCYDQWQRWEYKHYGGFEAARIERIPGAELIFYKDESSGFLPDYSTTWVYKIPSSYTEKLYKDCSAMRYKTGALIGYEMDGTERIDPKKSGCHTHIEPYRSETISVEFSGDQLTVKDSYGG